MNEALRIVVVAPDLDVADPHDDDALAQAGRSRSLRIGLLESGFNLVATLPGDVFLTERLTQLRPDLVIVDAESEARDALEHVVMATRDAPRPIVMFTNDSDTTHVKDAVAAGVSAYIVAGLAPERIRPILDVALARFQHEQALRQELALPGGPPGLSPTFTARPKTPGGLARGAGARPWPPGIGLQKRLFREGSDVKAGQALFEIDAAPMQARCQRAGHAWRGPRPT
jgi:response regulator NasT